MQNNESHSYICQKTTARKGDEIIIMGIGMGSVG